jgi:hypothetical protein
MNTIARGVSSLAVILTSVGMAEAGWWQLHEADVQLDLVAARSEASRTVTEDPTSAEAVAAAAWWSRNLELLSEPEAILSAAHGAVDPELAFVLSRIEGVLDSAPPRLCLPSAALAGPFGVLDTLDLERWAISDDSEMPPFGTRFTRSRQPFHLEINRVDGWVGPPEAMVDSGVWVASWNLIAARQYTGWLVAEIDGSANLELDGAEVARIRKSGEIDPIVSWFRLELGPGPHHLRVTMASSRFPKVRISLLDDDGRPLGLETVLGAAPKKSSESTVRAELPPASRAQQAVARAEGSSLKDQLLWTELVAARGDSRARRASLERAALKGDGNPAPALERARFLLNAQTGNDAEADFRMAFEAVRSANSVPMSGLIGHTLAFRQRRVEDAEAILGNLVDKHTSDPRVLQLWVMQSIRQGWHREAEENLELLQQIAPGSRAVHDLQLQVYEALEQWDKRNSLLLELGREDPGNLSRIQALATDCFAGEAITLLGTVAQSYRDPSLDLTLIRLLVEAGRLDEAAETLQKTVGRWGRFPALDELELSVAGNDAAALQVAIEGALERNPADLELRSLVWSRGKVPFYEPFRVDGNDVLQESPESPASIDSVLLLDQAVERVLGDGSSIYYYHGLTRALTPEGANQASTLEWMPGAVALNLRVLRRDGSVLVPTNGPNENGVVELVDLEPGDVIEEEYLAAVGPAVAAQRGHMSPYIYRFADSQRVFGRSEYVLIVPQEIDVQLEGRFEGLTFEETTRENTRIMLWRADNVEPVRNEPYAPPEQELLPWVTYGFGVSWEDVGDLVRDRMVEQTRATQDMMRWGREHLLGETAEEQLTSLVDALVDEVELGRRVLDLSHSAGESFSMRLGNRLAIVAAILVEEGWTVDLLLARPFAFAGTHLEVPNMDTFGIPILRVARGEEEIWLDIEEQRRGVGHLRPSLQRSDALRLPVSDPLARSEYLETLPEFPNPELEDVVRVRVDLDPTGSATVEVTIPLLGASAERAADQLRSMPPDRAEIAFRQLALGLFPSAQGVTGELEESDGAAALVLRMELPRACEADDGELTCRALVVARPISPSLAPLAERRFPLVLQLPIVQQVDLDLELPDGWHIDRSPRQLDTLWGHVTEKITTRTGGWSSSLRYEVPAQKVEPEEYDTFSRFCRAVDELVSRPPVLTRIQ